MRVADIRTPFDLDRQDVPKLSLEFLLNSNVGVAAQGDDDLPL